MRNKTIKSLLLPALCFIAANGQAQGTLEDYRRAYSLYEKFNATQVYNDPADIRWDGKTTFHYSVYTPEGTDYYVGKVTGDVKTADVKAIHMKALAELLSRETGKDIPRNTLRLSRLSVDESQPTSVSFEFDGYKWKVEEACTAGLRLGSKEELHSPKGPWKKPRHWMEVDDEKGAVPVVSPDGKRQAYIKNDNVYVSDRDGRHERALSNDGTARQLLFQLAQMEPGRQIRMCQQDTSGPETVCILRGKLAQKPASAHPSPTGIRQAGRRIALQGALHIQRGNRTGRHSIYRTLRPPVRLVRPGMERRRESGDF